MKTHTVYLRHRIRGTFWGIVNSIKEVGHSFKYKPQRYYAGNISQYGIESITKSMKCPKCEYGTIAWGWNDGEIYIVSLRWDITEKSTKCITCHNVIDMDLVREWYANAYGSPAPIGLGKRKPHIV